MTLKYDPKPPLRVPEDIYPARVTGYENLGEVYDDFAKDFREKMTLEYTLNYKDPDTGRYVARTVTYNSILAPKSKLFGHMRGLFGRALIPGEEIDFEKLAKLQPRCRVAMKDNVSPKDKLTYSNLDDVFPGEDAAKAIAVAIIKPQPASEPASQPAAPPDRAELMTQEINERVEREKAAFAAKQTTSVAREPLFPEKEADKKPSTVKVEGEADKTTITGDDIPVPF